MEKIKFTIIIPVYNSKKTINSCLKSCFEQLYKNYEVIVIDDGSIDNSIECIKKEYAADSRVKIFRQSNRGQFVARKTGLENGTGDFYLFLDSDDMLCTDALNTLYKIILKNDLPDSIVFNAFTYSKDKTPKPFTKKDYLSELNLHDSQSVLQEFYINGCFQYLWDKCYSNKLVKEFLSNNYLFNSKFGEDTLMSYLLLKNANNAVYCDKYLYQYNINPDSITHNLSYCDYKNCYINFVYLYSDLFKTNPKLNIKNKKWESYYSKALINFVVHAAKDLSFHLFKKETRIIKKDSLFDKHYIPVFSGLKNKFIYFFISHRFYLCLYIFIKMFKY